MNKNDNNRKYITGNELNVHMNTIVDFFFAATTLEVYNKFSVLTQIFVALPYLCVTDFMYEI